MSSGLLSKESCIFRGSLLLLEESAEIPNGSIRRVDGNTAGALLKILMLFEGGVVITLSEGGGGMVIALNSMLCEGNYDGRCQ